MIFGDKRGLDARDGCRVEVNGNTGLAQVAAQSAELSFAQFAVLIVNLDGCFKSDDLRQSGFIDGPFDERTLAGNHCRAGDGYGWSANKRIDRSIWIELDAALNLGRCWGYERADNQ